jgi:hypothetical protein
MIQKQVVFFILKILNECKKNYFAVCYSIKSIQLKFSFYWNFSSQFFRSGNNEEVCRFALPEIGL